jgi:hypothetical protein
LNLVLSAARYPVAAGRDRGVRPVDVIIDDHDRLVRPDSGIVGFPIPR